MNQTALILNHLTLYWYSIILALSAAFGMSIFMACCSRKGIHPGASAAVSLLALVISLIVSRLIYWYCNPFRFSDMTQAFTTPAADCNALLGAFVGCFLAALILHRAAGDLVGLLDCMSVAGCGAISLGRLAFFFADGDRGRIVNGLTNLPWVYPIINPSSGMPEYRLATFVFQSVLTGILFLVLLRLFLSPRMERKSSRGSITVLFLMAYGAAGIILDSTRYDSLYLRSNGFISLVQIVCAAAMLGAIVWVSIRAVKNRGLAKWMITAWAAIAALFGGAGYMEYFVQRHGRLAGYGYSAMAACLVCALVLGIVLWRNSLTQPELAEA